MSKIDYATMSLDEAKAYFLTHREDNEAFYAYMDKLHSSNRAIVIESDDPAWQEKVACQVQARLGQDLGQS
jgi:Ni/Co efflux regulator RcnB